MVTKNFIQRNSPKRQSKEQQNSKKSIARRGIMTPLILKTLTSNQGCDLVTNRAKNLLMRSTKNTRNLNTKKVLLSCIEGNLLE